jgi:hypothetical protein
MLMRYARVLRILAIVSILSLVLVLVPATPALAAPSISLSPTSGSPGTGVSVEGINFESYRGDTVSVFFGDRKLETLVVPDSGIFTIHFYVPDDATPDKVYVSVKDEQGNPLGNRRLFTVEEVGIEVHPRDGAVGTRVAITGTGFYADEMVTFYYDEVSVGTEAAGPTGEVSYTLAVPKSAIGEHLISAEDMLGNSGKASFKVISAIALAPSSGALGEKVAVDGTGFSGKSDITIYFDKAKITTGRTDKDGSFGVTFNVPVMPSGLYDVEAEDIDGNMGTAEFTIGAGVSLSRTEGHVGTTVTLGGIGFMVDGIVTVTYDDTEVDTAVAGSNGAFSVTFDVPASIGGNHTITASDGTNIVKCIFTMESEPPPVPRLKLPEEGSRAEAGTHFDWESVTDESLPVTYALQVATDEDFTADSIVLEKEGLTNSDYTITKAEEKLAPRGKETPYYWRVKAIDSASNESQRSTPGSFYVGSRFVMPRGAIYALIAIGVGFLAFWLGRRTAYRREYPRE